MRESPRVRVISSTLVPSNSESVILVDTTRMSQAGRLMEALPSASVAPASAYFTPSRERCEYVGYKVTGTIKVGNQAVTLKLYALTGAAGTSADWEVESSGSIALSASTTYPVEWTPLGNDFLLEVLAGAAAPNSLVANLRLIPLFPGS